MTRTTAAEQAPSTAASTTAARTSSSSPGSQYEGSPGPAGGEAALAAVAPGAARDVAGTAAGAAARRATLHYVRLEPDDCRKRFWALAKRERVTVEHDGKPHVLVAWTELLDPYRAGPYTVEVTLMRAGDYAELRASRGNPDRELPTRPARPGGSETSMATTDVRRWRTRGG